MPKQNKLNCDPSYELEERIVESSPLHKHYRRKQNMQKKRHYNSSAMTSNDTATQSSHNVLLDEAIQELSGSFVEYNRFNSIAHRANLVGVATNCPLASSSTDLPKHCPASSKSNKHMLQKAKSVRWLAEIMHLFACLTIVHIVFKTRHSENKNHWLLPILGRTMIWSVWIVVEFKLLSNCATVKALDPRRKLAAKSVGYKLLLD